MNIPQENFGSAEVRTRVGGVRSANLTSAICFYVSREIKETLRMNLLQENESLLEFLDSNEDEFRNETEIEDLRHKLKQLQLELNQILASEKRGYVWQPLI